MTLYTNEVRNYIGSRDWPKGLIFDVYEQALEIGSQLNFVFYRDNWLTLEAGAQFKAAMVVKEVMEKLRADGIPCYMGKMERKL